MLQVEKSLAQCLEELNLETATPAELEEYSLRILKIPHGRRSDREIAILVKFTEENSFIKDNAQNIDPQVHTDICQQLEYKAFPRGKTVFEQGSTGTALYIILKGSVTMHSNSTHTPDQEDNHNVQKKLYTGSYFGESAILEETLNPRTNTVVCNQECIFAVLDRKHYQKIIALAKQNHLMSQVTFLLQNPIFQNLSEYMLKSWVYLFEKRICNWKHVLYKEGDVPRDVYLIRSGQVSCTKRLSVPRKFEDNNAIVQNKDKSMVALMEKAPATREVSIGVYGEAHLFGGEEGLARLLTKHDEDHDETWEGRYREKENKFVKALSYIQKDSAEGLVLSGFQPLRGSTVTVASQEAEIWSVPIKAFFMKLLAGNNFQAAVTLLISNKLREEKRINTVQRDQSEYLGYITQPKPIPNVSRRSGSQLKRRIDSPVKGLNQTFFNASYVAVEPQPSVKTIELSDSFRKFRNQRDESPNGSFTSERSQVDKSVDFTNTEKFYGKPIKANEPLQFSPPKGESFSRTDKGFARQSCISFKALKSTASGRQLTDSGSESPMKNDNSLLRISKLNLSSLRGNVPPKEEKSALIEEKFPIKESKPVMISRIANSQTPSKLRKTPESFNLVVKAKPVFNKNVGPPVSGQDRNGDPHWSDGETFIEEKSRAARIKAEIEGRWNKEHNEKRKDVDKRFHVMKYNFMQKLLEKNKNKNKLNIQSMMEADVEKQKVEQIIKERFQKYQEKSFILFPTQPDADSTYTLDLPTSIDSGRKKTEGIEPIKDMGTDREVLSQSKKAYEPESISTFRKSVDNRNSGRKILDDKEKKVASMYRISPLVPRMEAVREQKKSRSRIIVDPREKKEEEPKRIKKQLARSYVESSEKKERSFFQESQKEVYKMEAKFASEKAKALGDILREVYKSKG